MVSTEQERLGEAIAQARQAVGWTQLVAAKRLGVSQSRLAKLETGRRRLTFLEAVALARAYGVSITDFEPGAPPAVASSGVRPGGQPITRRGRPRRTVVHR